MFMAPVPLASTLAATVPRKGLRATTIGSCAGLSAVPQPSHAEPSSPILSRALATSMDLGKPEP